MSQFLEKSLKANVPMEQIKTLDLFSYQELVKKLRAEPERAAIKSGSNALDEIIGGFEKGRLYVLAGTTKGGKTTLAQTLMYNLGRQNVPSVFFSYEMGWQEVVKKYMAMDGLRSSQGTPTNLPLYMPIDLYRGGELQFDWIREAIQKGQREYNAQFVVIDHLHFLLPLKDYQNLSMIIGGIVREIKKMAVNLDIPILLLCHLQKNATKEDAAPSWTDIRDSSFIAQEADSTLLIWRGKDEEATKSAKRITSMSTADVYTNKSMLSVELNRMNGKTGRVLYWHNGAMFEPYVNQDGKANR